jgi:NOL1/NOP2/fmu family ribosome biogenesis protein
MNILSKKETKEIERLIERVYGAEDSLKGYIVLNTGKENKIWLASPKIFEMKLELLRISNIGLYFGRIDQGRLRMSVEGAGIVGPKASKNTAEIDEAALWEFLRGFDVKPASLENAEEGTYVIVRCGKEWIGVSKLQNNMLMSCLPKSRKIISLTKQ